MEGPRREEGGIERGGWRVQALQDRYGGWTNSQIVNDFANYAEVAFKNFGGKVNHWMTLNEPRSFCWLGYGIGIHAPGIKVLRPAPPFLPPPLLPFPHWLQASTVDGKRGGVSHLTEAAEERQAGWGCTERAVEGTGQWRLIGMVVLVQCAGCSCRRR